VWRVNMADSSFFRIEMLPPLGAAHINCSRAPHLAARVGRTETGTGKEPRFPSATGTIGRSTAG
jgi:hypothetical protein